jgi:hypothetical protein
VGNSFGKEEMAMSNVCALSPWLIVPLLLGAQCLGFYAHGWVNPRRYDSAVARDGGAAESRQLKAKLDLTIRLIEPGHCSPPLSGVDYTIYLDRRRLDKGSIDYEELHCQKWNISQGIRKKYVGEVAPGRHTIAVLLNSTWIGRPRLPFEKEEETVDFQGDRVSYIELDFDCRRDEFALDHVTVSDDVDAELDHLAGYVTKHVDALKHDKMYTEMLRVKSEKRGGKYASPAIYDGVELDVKQMEDILNWLEDRYLDMPERWMAGRFRVPLKDFNENQKRRYFDLLAVIDSHRRALRDVHNYLAEFR